MYKYQSIQKASVSKYVFYVFVLIIVSISKEQQLVQNQNTVDNKVDDSQMKIKSEVLTKLDESSQNSLGNQKQVHTNKQIKQANENVVVENNELKNENNHLPQNKQKQQIIKQEDKQKLQNDKVQQQTLPQNIQKEAQKIEQKKDFVKNKADQDKKQKIQQEQQSQVPILNDERQVQNNKLVAQTQEHVGVQQKQKQILTAKKQQTMKDNLQNHNQIASGLHQQIKQPQNQQDIITRSQTKSKQTSQRQQTNESEQLGQKNKQQSVQKQQKIQSQTQIQKQLNSDKKIQRRQQKQKANHHITIEPIISFVPSLPKQYSIARELYPNYQKLNANKKQHKNTHLSDKNIKYKENPFVQIQKNFDKIYKYDQPLISIVESKNKLYNPFSHIFKNKQPEVPEIQGQTVKPVIDNNNQPIQNQISAGQKQENNKQEQAQKHNSKPTVSSQNDLIKKSTKNDKVQKQIGQQKKDEHKAVEKNIPKYKQKQKLKKDKQENSDSFSINWSQSWTILVCVILVYGTYQVISSTISNPHRFFPVSQHLQAQVQSNRIQFDE